MSPAKLQRLLAEAVAHHRSGRLAEAESLYARVCREQPGNFDAHHLGGVAAYQQNRLPEAIRLLTRALQLEARSAICAMHLGLALIGAGRLAEAESHLRAAVQQKPDYAEAWDNLAYCLKATGRLQQAMEYHQKVVALKPDFARGWHNFGLTCSLLGRVQQALQCHDRALAADPGYAMGHFGRAQALLQSYRSAEAVAEYDRLLEREPRHYDALSYRLFALHYLDGISRERLLAEHVAYGRTVGTTAPPDFPQTRDPARRLRVAILSPDLRTHSCAYFIAPILHHLARDQFEIVLYMTTPMRTPFPPGCAPMPQSGATSSAGRDQKWSRPSARTSPTFSSIWPATPP
jgi:tetratricopeptide (TPR) repeat protein